MNDDVFTQDFQTRTFGVKLNEQEWKGLWLEGPFEGLRTIYRVSDLLCTRSGYLSIVWKTW